MCLIAVNRSGSERHNMKYLKYAYDNNPHGCGIMWSDGTTLFRMKDFMTFEDIIDVLDDIDGYPHAVHFRYKTKGLIDKNNLHPFRVLRPERHGVDLAVMHNGTLDIPINVVGDSDTRSFVRLIRPLLRKNGHDWIFDDNAAATFQEGIGKNRLVWMDNAGRIQIMNQSLGFWEDGIWYSNRYSLVPKDMRMAAFYHENNMSPKPITVPFRTEYKYQNEADFCDADGFYDSSKERHKARLAKVLKRNDKREKSHFARV